MWSVVVEAVVVGAAVVQRTAAAVAVTQPT